MRFIVFVLAGLVLLSCKDVAVRDAEVYKQEIEFVNAASEEQVERSKALIGAACTCSMPIEDVVVFDSSECEKLAETVLVVEARMKYHTDFMKYLGGLSEERPPKDAPEIPDSVTLCPKVEGE